MPVKYSVKRNALSSKWGVWTVDPDSKSPVENLVAEFKKGEDAESYQARIEAGETHDDIIASLSAKKPKAAGSGGVMGKLFKRGSREQLPVDATEPAVHNPVIEIAAPSKRVDEVSTPEVEETPVAAKPARMIEAPSRFQIIEQPPAPAPPVPTAEPVVEAKKITVAAEEVPVSEDVPVVVENVEEPLAEIEATTVPESLPEVSSAGDSPVERLPEASAEEPASPTASQPAKPVEILAVAEPVEEINEPEEVSVVSGSTPEIAPEPETLSVKAEQQPVVEEIAPVETASQVKTMVEPTDIATVPTPAAPAPAPLKSQPAEPKDESRLVDWTFTPPPDVTPEELRSSASTLAVQPAVVTQTEDSNKVDPEWAGPAKTARTAKASAQNDGGISQDPGTGRVTVDICVSKALRDSSGGDARIPDKKYNSIASKEYTEVSKAYANGNSPESLREELTHLAAVCLAWADAIEKRQSSSTEVKAA